MSHTTPLTPDEKTALLRYRRAVDFLAAAQVYLQSNALLERPLTSADIKDRLLGHWGTDPGINLVYAHLNRLVRQTGAGALLVTGPGHGAAANLANMYLEGTITEFYPQYTRDREGLERFVRAFSWPGGFPSHLNPGLPGVINEGGELGYSLSVSFGAALDNPDLLVVCLVGDGEAETGPMATAWHGNKFLNPATDGAVLPILHLNGWKISSPSIYATMSEEQLTDLFRGYGYEPRWVKASERLDEDMAEAMGWAYESVRAIQTEARAGRPPERAIWPLLIMETPKGMGCPAEIDGQPMEGTWRAHQVPGKDLKTNPAHLEIVERWLRSYRPEELWDAEGRPAADIVACCPRGEQRVALNPHGFGGRVRRPLVLPRLEDFALPLAQRGAVGEGMAAVGKYLAELVRLNAEQRNFRVVCPDELESNRLQDLLATTQRQYTYPVSPLAENIGRDGRVLETLSEHNCQGWLQGYLLTGRHGLYPCYEGFIPLVDSMMNQYAKFLKSALEVPWREPVSSLIYLLTSVAWRQDHNGYSHQGPGFIGNVLTKKGHTYRVDLPPDGNSLLVTMEERLAATDLVSVIVADKQPAPQWLSLEEAREHCRVGASIWSWASTEDGESPEIVLACCGDHLTVEVMAAAQILREEAPTWRVRVVNITELLVLGIPQKYPPGMDEAQFQRLFPLDCPVIFNFHGYTAPIKQLLWERPGTERFDINGYREEGTTTTPFDMQVANRTSRFHLVMQTAEKIAARHPHVAGQAEALIRRYQAKLLEHKAYIREQGTDLPEVRNWRWSG
ncbi:MAG TPA: phosphoketolase family protein [Armatimonadota bacterium]|jgi:xylulose-5-phosphate/fructose-6-phosphate phosphoketolase